MTYRPLNPNEHAIVSRTIYDERGLSGGLAESMFIAYKARAMALDEPEFVIFQESEEERKIRHAEKQREKVVELQAGTELAPMEFLRKLEALSKYDKPRSEPKNCYEWFYGDESLLDSRRKRLRMKFFNSEKYRRIVLREYIEYGFLNDAQLKNPNLIGPIIGRFHELYPATRQGIISYYERLFGDASSFSYGMVMERNNFFNDPAFRVQLLRKLQLPDDLTMDEIRDHLKHNALESGTVTAEQIQAWEIH